MFRGSRSKRTRGQALVEFTLAATLIFVLLSAAVDLGLMFFSFQALRTAAQEGATFGSHPEIYTNGAEIERVDLNYSEIVQRVRFSGGDAPSGFVNLLDLDNDGRDDSTQGGIIDDPTDASSYVYVENLRFVQDQLVDNSGQPVAPTGPCATDIPRTGLRNAGQYCYVRVTVSYEYRFIFPLAPVFGDTVRLRASHMIRVRSSFIG